MCVWPPPLANAGGWIARSQAAGPPGQLPGQLPGPEKPERAGISGTRWGTTSGSPNRIAKIEAARPDWSASPGWGARYPHLLAEACPPSICQVGQGLHRLGARPREETGGMGLFGCQPIRGNALCHLSSADFVPAGAARHQQGPLACNRPRDRGAETTVCPGQSILEYYVCTAAFPDLASPAR